MSWDDHSRSQSRYTASAWPPRDDGYRPRLAPRWWLWPVLAASIALNVLLLGCLSLALGRV